LIVKVQKETGMFGSGGLMVYRGWLMVWVTVAAFVVPVSLEADLLLPGYKSVRHELVFEDSELFRQHRLIAAPIRGFSGIEEIKPGTRFSFSNKYGTRFYLVPDEVPLPEDFTHEVFAQWPRQEPPVSEINMVPVVSSVDSALTTLRFAGVTESGPRIEVVSHVELDRWGRPASTARSMLVFGMLIAAGLACCLLVLRRLRSRSKR
jgi:hypothetical protein